MYDADSLMQRLHLVGFTEIESVEYRHGRCRAAAELDNQPRSSVYIEALKPS